MPSSTSSSEPAFFEREIPEHNWLRIALVAFALAAAVSVCWELRVRSLGYRPTSGDTPNLWAVQRERASGTGPDQVVFVGSSRTLYDMDLDAFRAELGGPLPVQLATVGTNPLAIFENLANDTSFSGTVIFGVVPGLLAASGGPPVKNAQKYLSHYKSWSPAQRFELPLVLWLEDRWALINQGDLTLSALIGHSGLPLRDGVYSPSTPGYIHTVSRERLGRLADKISRDPGEAEKVQQVWLPLFRGPPRPPIFTPEQWAKLLADGWTANLTRLTTSVKKLEARGGKVIFSRLPSSGEVLELENKNTPRALFWDRILRETGAPGIYFEDYRELREFKCPEWSHLSGPDATEYTRRLARILREQKLL